MSISVKQKCRNSKTLMSKFSIFLKKYLLHKAFTILYIVGKILDILSICILYENSLNEK